MLDFLVSRGTKVPLMISDEIPKKIIKKVPRILCIRKGSYPSRIEHDWCGNKE
jgi:hypothetical protein